MLTIDALKRYGANTDEGLARCMNMEPFYLKMVGMVLAEPNFEKLRNAMAAGDTRMAFEAAHALKSVTGNLSLVPMFKPVCALSDMLKGHTDEAMSPECERLANEIELQYERLKAL